MHQIHQTHQLTQNHQPHQHWNTGNGFDCVQLLIIFTISIFIKQITVKTQACDAMVPILYTDQEAPELLPSLSVIIHIVSRFFFLKKNN